MDKSTAQHLINLVATFDFAATQLVARSQQEIER
jgi:hypothetical protein